MTAETRQHLELKAFGIRRIEVGEGNDFLIAVAKTDEAILEARQVMSQLNGPFPIAEIPVCKQTLLIEAKGLTVHEKPQPSRSIGSEIPGKASQALYYFRSRYNSPAVQGYLLEEGATTSHHHHNEHWEELIPIVGEAEVMLDEVSKPFKQTEKLDARIRHMLKGGEGGAFVICITYGSGDCFSMDDHIYNP